MPSLKSLLVLLALATIGYGVYTKLGQPGREVVWNTGESLKNTFFGENTSPAASQPILQTPSAQPNAAVTSDTMVPSDTMASNATIPTDLNVASNSANVVSSTNVAQTPPTRPTRPFDGCLDLPNGSAPNPGDFLTEHTPMVPRSKDDVHTLVVPEQALGTTTSPEVVAADAVRSHDVPSNGVLAEDSTLTENTSTAAFAETHATPLVMGGGTSNGNINMASPIQTATSSGTAPSGGILSSGTSETSVHPASASLSMDAIPSSGTPLSPLRIPQEQEWTQQLQVEAQRDIEFRRRMAEAHQRVDSGNTAEYERTLRELTDVYRHTSLNAVQRDELVQMLDDLAYGAIWSQNYYLTPPIKATGTETMLQIAAQCGISPRLLIRINRLEGVVTNLQQPLPIGTVVKTLRGPFEAEISLERREMTIYVDQMYAGRFAVGFGSDFQPKTGSWSVVEKLKAMDEKSPVVVGIIQLDPASGLCLHGTPNAAAITQGSAAGSILLSREDMTDLLDILTRDPSQRFTSHVSITM